MNPHRVECAECGRVAFRRSAELEEEHRVSARRGARACPGRWRLEPREDRIQLPPAEPWDGFDHTAEFLAMPGGVPPVVVPRAAAVLVDDQEKQRAWAW